MIDFMRGSFDILMNTANETGYAHDDGRLVQWWFWFILYDAIEFPTGNLYDPEADQLTSIGKAFSDYISGD